MQEIGSDREVSPESARALVVVSWSECPGCGMPLTDRQRGACSGKCRAKLSRQRQAEALQTEVRDLGYALELLSVRHAALVERVQALSYRPTRRRNE